MFIIFRSLRVYIIGLGMCGLLLAMPLSFASAQIPFGGIITQYFPGCVAPGGAAMMINQPLQSGGFVPVPLMYIPGLSFSFAYGPPSHTGQWLLGMGGAFSPCLVPCTSGLCVYPGQPGGLVILYHGSSQ